MADAVMSQRNYRVRFDWGLAGALAVCEGAATVVLVDVLSFTTTLSVAADAGTEVFPYRWRDESAATFARRHNAALAVKRSQAEPGEVSLSPDSLRRADHVERLVLPSPNGSAIAHAVRHSGRAVMGTSLRNSAATAEWVAELLRRDDTPSVAVVAAGEQWPNGQLRPATEDL